MEYALERENSASSTNPIGRSLRACRRCRRLKMKCDSGEHVPCTRCRKARVECRVDVREKTSGPSAGPASLDQQTVRALMSQAQELREQLRDLRHERMGFPDARRPLEDTPRTSAVAQQVQMEIATESREEDQAVQFNELTAEEMVAPLTAVDSLASSSKNASNGQISSLKTSVGPSDLISKGIMSEERA